MGWRARSVFTLWLLFLAFFVVLEVFSTLGGEPPISVGVILLGGGMLAGAVAVEWPWRSAGERRAASFLRLVLVAMAALWVNVAIGTLVPTRNALQTEQRVVVNAGDAGLYTSGVLTMQREVTLARREARLPLIVLVLLCAGPGLRVLIEDGAD